MLCENTETFTTATFACHHASQGMAFVLAHCHGLTFLPSFLEFHSLPHSSSFPHSFLLVFIPGSSFLPFCGPVVPGRLTSHAPGSELSWGGIFAFLHAYGISLAHSVFLQMTFSVCFPLLQIHAKNTQHLPVFVASSIQFGRMGENFPPPSQGEGRGLCTPSLLPACSHTEKRRGREAGSLVWLGGCLGLKLCFTFPFGSSFACGAGEALKRREEKTSYTCLCSVREKEGGGSLVEAK